MFSVRYRLITKISSVALAATLTLMAAAQGVRSGAPGASQAPVKRPARGESAWTIITPLGDHSPASFDTIPTNYHLSAIPSMVTPAQATTGNLGAPTQTQIFFDRPDRPEFFFLSAIQPWRPTLSTAKFYDVFVPMTLASYTFGGNKDNGQERVGAIFAGNVNRRIGIGANIDYLYSKGMYNYQAVKDINYGFNAYYTGDRYAMQALFYQFNNLNKENGGITDPLYITDPAVLQGGVSKIESKSIPTNLTNAHSRLKGKRFFMTHTYNVGFWHDVEVNDTLTREEYVPVTKFIYSLDYQKAEHVFRNAGATDAKEFWDDFYLWQPGQTVDRTSYSSLTNTFGIAMIEGFRKWAQFGLSAYASYEHRSYRQANYGWTQPVDEETGEPLETGLTPLPQGVSVAPTASQNIIWVGGRLDKTKGSLLTYDADVKFGLTGDCAGDIRAIGNAATNIPMFGDTVMVAARARFTNEAQPYLMRHYISNHFVWDNDFGKTRTFGIGGTLFVPWTDSKVDFDYRTLQNYTYFGVDGMPRQESGAIHVVAASLEQKLSRGIWHWDNRLTLQTSSNKDALPLPAFSIYSNLYVNFTAFRVLNLQVGVDCDYYTRYRGVNYQPATMAFTVGDDWQIGNFPFMDLYVNAKLYKVKFYVLYSHFNQGWFTKDIFSMPLYPVNPCRLLFGLSVDFKN